MSKVPKFTIKQAALLAALKSVAPACDPAGAMPVLGSVLVNATGHSISMRCTNLDQTLELKAKASASGEISFSANVRMMLAIVKIIGGDVLTITQNGNEIGISSGARSYTMPCMPGDEYPEAPEVEQNHEARWTFKIMSDSLAKIIRYTSLAIPKRDPRKVLKGIFFTLKDNDLEACATDGRRLCRMQSAIRASKPGKTPTNFIFPDSAMKLAAAFQPGVELSFTVYAKMVCVESPSVRLVSRTIEGTYPAYMKVIPPAEHLKQSVEVSLRDFVAELRCGLIVAETKHNSAVLCFEGGGLTVETKSLTDGGTFFSESNLISETGSGSIKIAVSAKLAVDMLSKLPGDSVILRFQNETSPILIGFDGDESMDFLLMPVRMSDLEQEEAA